MELQRTSEGFVLPQLNFNETVALFRNFKIISNKLFQSRNIKEYEKGRKRWPHFHDYSLVHPPNRSLSETQFANICESISAVRHMWSTKTDGGRVHALTSHRTRLMNTNTANNINKRAAESLQQPQLCGATVPVQLTTEQRHWMQPALQAFCSLTVHKRLMIRRK